MAILYAYSIPVSVCVHFTLILCRIMNVNLKASVFISQVTHY